MRAVALVALAAAALVVPHPTPASAMTPNENFVNRVYEDFFFREATTNELLLWTTYLGSNSRASMVETLLEGTDFATLWVSGVNQTYLGYFDATDASVQAQISAVDSSDNFLATEYTVLTGPEYWELAGSTNAGFVTKMLTDLWLRPPTTGEQSTYLSLVTGSGRPTAVLTALVDATTRTTRIAGTPGATSCESTVLSNPEVAASGSFCIVLDRLADPSGLSFYTGYLNGTAANRLPLAWVHMAGSTEYFNHAQL